MTGRLAAAGTLAYTLFIFPLAVIWHAVLFRGLYDRFGYFEGDPGFALGFLTIVIQGFILSLFYPHVSFTGGGVMHGLKYAAVLGRFSGSRTYSPLSPSNRWTARRCSWRRKRATWPSSSEYSAC